MGSISSLFCCLPGEVTLSSPFWGFYNVPLTGLCVGWRNCQGNSPLQYSCFLGRGMLGKTYSDRRGTTLVSGHIRGTHVTSLQCMGRGACRRAALGSGLPSFEQLILATGCSSPEFWGAVKQQQPEWTVLMPATASTCLPSFSAVPQTGLTAACRWLTTQGLTTDTP